MKSRGFVYLSAFGVLILAIGLACGPVTTVTTPQVIVVTATAAPVNTAAPVDTAPATVITASATDAASTTTSGLKTFTDQNKYYAIDVPADWTYSQTLDKTNNYYYVDQFKSPDGNALVENMVYNDGTAFSGTDNGRFALYLLNTFYSNTGKEGDIRVTDTGTEKDGSQRLNWTSKGGGYSGISYFELRDSYTFLMITIDWGNSQKDKYFDVLGNVISSYRKP